MELVNTLFASLVGTDPFTGVDITIANCKSAYWDEGIVQQLINQALDEGEKFVGADGLEGLLRYNVTLKASPSQAVLVAAPAMSMVCHIKYWLNVQQCMAGIFPRYRHH